MLKMPPISLTHQVVKVPGQRLHAVADWNADHQVTANIDISPFDFTTTGDGFFDNITLTGNITLPPTTATDGIYFLGVNRFLHSFGISNTFLGVAAGNFILTGTNNVGVGLNSLTANLSGDFNVAVGVNSLLNNTEGNNNTCVGTSSLLTNTEGELNTAVGVDALRANTTGDNNTACGVSALFSNTLGTLNVAIGVNTLYNNTTGVANTGVGEGGVLFTQTTASSNVALGYGAGYYETLGNKLFIDNLPRDDEADGRVKALIYGVFDPLTANQILRFNANVEILENLTFIGSAGLPFGSCSGYHINWLQVAAQNVWYNVVDADFINGQLNNVTHDGNGKLTVLKAGIYKVDVNLDLEVNGANVHVEVGFEVNGSGAAQTEGILCNETKFANEEHQEGTTALLDLAANDTIELCVRTIDAGNPTIEVDCVTLNCVQIGGT